MSDDHKDDEQQPSIGDSEDRLDIQEQRDAPEAEVEQVEKEQEDTDD